MLSPRMKEKRKSKGDSSSKKSQESLNKGGSLHSKTAVVKKIKAADDVKSIGSLEALMLSPRVERRKAGTGDDKSVTSKDSTGITKRWTQKATLADVEVECGLVEKVVKKPKKRSKSKETFLPKKFSDSNNATVAGDFGLSETKVKTKKKRKSKGRSESPGSRSMFSLPANMAKYHQYSGKDPLSMSKGSLHQKLTKLFRKGNRSDHETSETSPETSSSSNDESAKLSPVSQAVKGRGRSLSPMRTSKNLNLSTRSKSKVETSKRNRSTVRKSSKPKSLKDKTAAGDEIGGSLEEQIVALKKANESLQSELEEKTISLKELTDQVKDLKKKKSSSGKKAEERIAKLEKKLREKDSQIAYLDSKMCDYVLPIKVGGDSESDLHARSEEDEAIIASLRSQLQHAQEEVARKHAEVEEKKAQVLSQNQHNAKLEEALQNNGLETVSVLQGEILKLRNETLMLEAQFQDYKSKTSHRLKQKDEALVFFRTELMKAKRESNDAQQQLMNHSMNLSGHGDHSLSLSNHGGSKHSYSGPTTGSSVREALSNLIPSSRWNSE